MDSIIHDKHGRPINLLELPDQDLKVLVDAIFSFSLQDLPEVRESLGGPEAMYQQLLAMKRRRMN